LLRITNNITVNGTLYKYQVIAEERMIKLIHPRIVQVILTDAIPTEICHSEILNDTETQTLHADITELIRMINHDQE